MAIQVTPVISATLDASVIIRALHFGGPAAVIIGHARAGRIRIDVSDPTLAETNRVLRDKFQWGGYMLQDARAKLLALGNRVSPSETLHVSIGEFIDLALTPGTTT